MVAAVRAGHRTGGVPITLGTIVINLVDGNTLYFGGGVDDLKRLDPEMAAAVANEAAELLVHSMAASCWASHGYVSTLQALWSYVPERVT